VSNGWKAGSAGSLALPHHAPSGLTNQHETIQHRIQPAQTQTSPDLKQRRPMPLADPAPDPQARTLQAEVLADRDPKACNQLRVTLRRLRTALGLFEAALVVRAA